jgi:hypothetical protein
VQITVGYKDNFAAAVNFLAQSIMPLKTGNTCIYKVEIEAEKKTEEEVLQSMAGPMLTGCGRFIGGCNLGGQQGGPHPCGRGCGTHYIPL